MLRIKDMAPGEIAVIRELIGGEVRETVYERLPGEHPTAPRFVRTAIRVVVQWRDDQREAPTRYRWGGQSEQWTDGLYPVTQTISRETMQAASRLMGIDEDAA